MNMHRLGLLILIVAFCVSGALADPTASIFVKDAEEFAAIQKDLENLKSGLGSSPELDSLWNEASFSMTAS